MQPSPLSIAAAAAAAAPPLPASWDTPLAAMQALPFDFAVSALNHYHHHLLYTRPAHASQSALSRANTTPAALDHTHQQHLRTEYMIP
jgi:hypothetical protein